MTRDWFAVFAGPLAWFAAHVASWMLVPGAHDAGSVVGLIAIDSVAMAVAAAGAVIAARRVRALSAVPQVSERRTQCVRFVAVAGLGLSALSLLLVLGILLPVLLLAPGAEP